MTRKHFIALARICKENKERPMTPEELAEEIADFCRSENGNFDRQRFLTACGL